MTEYSSSVKILSDGLVGLDSEFGRQLFTIRKARKDVRGGCASCIGAIAKGELCWGPLTNGMNRMDRICSGCMNRLCAQAPS